eukprot:2078408-Prymnesium_polylepis.1
MSVAAFTPVRVWSSVGRIFVGSNGFGVPPMGKMQLDSNMASQAAAKPLSHRPTSKVLPHSTRDMTAAVTISRACIAVP